MGVLALATAFFGLGAGLALFFAVSFAAFFGDGFGALAVFLAAVFTAALGSGFLATCLDALLLGLGFLVLFLALATGFLLGFFAFDLLVF